MIPVPHTSSKQRTRGVPCKVGHLRYSCVLARGHAGTCLPAPARAVLSGAR